MRPFSGIALIVLGITIAIGINLFHLIIPVILIYLGIKLVIKTRGEKCNTGRY